MANVEQVFAEIEHRLISRPSNIAGYSAHYQFIFDDSELYHLSITNGVPDVGPGGIQSAQLTILMSSEDFIALAQGKLDSTAVQEAVQDQRITLQGDLSLAALLPDFLQE